MLVKNKTIRFDNENNARKFAEKSNGKFIECHGLEASKYKVKVKTENAPKKSNKKRPLDIGNEWIDFAKTSGDY